MEVLPAVHGLLLKPKDNFTRNIVSSGVFPLKIRNWKQNPVKNCQRKGECFMLSNYSE